MIKNIILDVGKVLVEWEPAAMLKKLGLDEETIRIVTEATVDSAEWNELDKGSVSNEVLLDGFIAKIPDYEKEVRLLWENIGKAIWQYEYVRPWIRSMKEKGYGVYILSNYGSWTYENTQEALSFLADVDGAVFSYQVKQIKPNPQIYQMFLEKYDLRAEECVFIDDRQDNIDAACELGIRGIRFTGYENANEQLKACGVEL